MKNGGFTHILLLAVVLIPTILLVASYLLFGTINPIEAYRFANRRYPPGSIYTSPKTCSSDTDCGESVCNQAYPSTCYSYKCVQGTCITEVKKYGK